MAPPARMITSHGALWCHLPTTFQAASRRAPTCRVSVRSKAAFTQRQGQTGRRVNEHGRGPITLGEFNQRYQCWANPRREFILIWLRTNIIPRVQEDLSHSSLPPATYQLVWASYRLSYDIYRLYWQHVDFYSLIYRLCTLQIDRVFYITHTLNFIHRISKFIRYISIMYATHWPLQETSRHLCALYRLCTLRINHYTLYRLCMLHIEL